jgi:hypothetical protein
MIYSQGPITFTTVLAGIIIAAEHLAAGQFDVWTRFVNLRLQPNDGRSWQQLLYRSDVTTPIHHHVSLTRKDQANSPSRSTNIDRFEIGIEHKHRFVHTLPPQ